MDAARAPATRLFFAVVPDALARDRLAPIAQDAAARTGGRATLPRTLHLTLVFVGAVAPEAVARVREAGASIAWARGAIALDTLGWFARAKVAWAAPSLVDRALADAQAALVAALAQRAIDTEPRPWRPHVTLARDCKRRIDGTIDPPVAWTVDRVVLIGSELEANGPRYRELDAWPAR